MFSVISRVKSAVIGFITGGHSDKQAQYGTAPTAPATPASGGTSTTPQTTTPAPQPPAGMTCPAGQKMMLDPQTNQWKCMPETMAQLQPLPARAPVLKKLPERVEKTEMVMTPVGPRPARVIGMKPKIIARISERFIRAQELSILQDLAEENFGVALSNDQSVDLLRWLWKYRITSPEEKVSKIGEWITAKGLESTLVREPIAKKTASQTGRAELYAKIYIDKEELEYDDRVQAILKSSVSDEEKATQIEGVVYELILEKMQNKEIDIKDWSLDSTKDIDYDYREIQRIIQEYNDLRDLDNAQDQEFGEGGKKEGQTNVIREIERLKQKLINYVSKHGLYENFGQKEVSELQAKYFDHQYKNDGIWQAIEAFDNWAMNYTSSGREGQLTDLMDSHIDPHADVFDWAVETFGPEDIIKTLKIEDVENVNLDNYKDQITQNYLPSYKDQIMSSDFDELFDRKDPVIEEQEYDSEKDWGDKWLEDDEHDSCEIDKVDSEITAKKSQYKVKVGDRVLFRTDDKSEEGTVVDVSNRVATIKTESGDTVQKFIWMLVRRGQLEDPFQQLTWVWDDGIKDWKQVPVMSEWDTLMERRVQRQGPKKAKLSGRQGQTQQLKVGDLLESKQDNSRWTVVQMGVDESFYARPTGETKGGFKYKMAAWPVFFRLVPSAETSLSVPPSSSYRSSPRGIMPGVASKKAQTQAQMEKTVPAEVTPVNPAPAVNKAEPLKPGEVPVILEDEEGETVKPKGKTEEESKAEEKVDLSREEKVKKDVETLRDNIINLANSVYSIEMSDNQVTDLMGKVMGFLSESISEVTLGRVQDIVGDLLPRKARLSGRVGQRSDNKFIAEIETNGTEIKAYPVDESQVVSNAGDAVVYEYKGKTYEVITWRANAEEHQTDEKTIGVLSNRAGQSNNKIWQVGILDNGKYRQIDIELGPESNKQDVIEELKRRGEKGEILSVVTDREKRLSNRKGHKEGKLYFMDPEGGEISHPKPRQPTIRPGTIAWDSFVSFVSDKMIHAINTEGKTLEDIDLKVGTFRSQDTTGVFVGAYLDDFIDDVRVEVERRTQS